MQFYLGIDMGGSAVKLIAASVNNGTLDVLGRTSYPSGESVERLENEARKLISELGLSEKDIVGAALTGVGASDVADNFLGAPVTRFSEFECFGRGGQYLSGHNKALVVSMGTGTAFVRADGDTYIHLGGSGVGGGALSGLSELITGVRRSSEINKMISAGSAARVDLTIGDICKGDVGGLSPDVTAANFGKKVMSTDKNDIAAGLANMVFQTAGVMAALACKNTDYEHVVFVGAMTEIPEGREMLRAVGNLPLMCPQAAHMRERWERCSGAVSKYKSRAVADDCSSPFFCYFIIPYPSFIIKMRLTWLSMISSLSSPLSYAALRSLYAVS